ncbi:hypothetical protein VTN96DRAFT_9194 [Rasamsonia emersonii]
MTSIFKCKQWVNSTEYLLQSSCKASPLDGPCHVVHASWSPVANTPQGPSRIHRHLLCQRTKSPRTREPSHSSSDHTQQEIRTRIKDCRIDSYLHINHIHFLLWRSRACLRRSADRATAHWSRGTGARADWLRQKEQLGLPTRAPRRVSALHRATTPGRQRSSPPRVGSSTSSFSQRPVSTLLSTCPPGSACISCQAALSTSVLLRFLLPNVLC